MSRIGTIGRSSGSTGFGDWARRDTTRGLGLWLTRISCLGRGGGGDGGGVGDRGSSNSTGGGGDGVGNRIRTRGFGGDGGGEGEGDRGAGRKYLGGCLGN